VIKPRIGAALLIILWTGCTIGPDYERPIVPEPETFRSEAEEAIDMTSLADMPWWDLFQDKELQNLIRIALEENKDLQVAVVRVDEARAEVGITRSVLFPQLESDASYTRTGINSVSIPGENGKTDIATDIYRLGGSLSWEIDIWGQLRRATEAARAELLASEEARRAIIIRLISEVAQSYFELRALDLEIEITRKTVKSRLTLSRIVTARHEDGLVSGLDKVRAEAEVVKILAEIPDLERQIVQQENALSILLGRNPASIPRGGELVNQTTPPVIPAGLPSSLLERRPDILEAEQNLVAANAEIGVAKGNFFPRITLTGQLGVTSRDFDDLFTGPAKVWGFGPGITLPIFTGGRNLSNLEAAEARKQQALIQYEQAIQQAFREVDDALIAYQKIREVRSQQEKLVEMNHRTIELAEYRYEEGLSDYIDVLDAQRQLFEAEIDLARTRRSQLVAVVQLYKALGGGWSPAPSLESSNNQAPL
jgi:multidrug efflux system outer membrane protein